MDSQSKRHLDSAISLLKSKDLFLFSGAGLSNTCGLPTWSSLASECLRSFSEEPSCQEEILYDLRGLIRSGRLTDLFDFMMGNSICRLAIQKVFEKYFDKDIHNEFHSTLLDLSFKGYITINYDRCFEDAVNLNENKRQAFQGKWFCYPPHKRMDYPTFTTEQLERTPYILHIHGCYKYEDVTDLDHLVLSRKQYDQFYSTKEMKSI